MPKLRNITAVEIIFPFGTTSILVVSSLLGGRAIYRKLQELSTFAWQTIFSYFPWLSGNRKGMYSSRRQDQEGLLLDHPTRGRTRVHTCRCAGCALKIKIHINLAMVERDESTAGFGNLRPHISIKVHTVTSISTEMSSDEHLA